MFASGKGNLRSSTVITSIPLRLLSLARDLKRRKAREARGLFTIEGTRAVSELIDSPLRIRGVLREDGYGQNPRERELLSHVDRRGVEMVTVGADDLASVADTEQPQGIVAVAEIPRARMADLADRPMQRWLVLDAVQDPGNLGTNLRTAAAFGVSGVLILPGTVDPWNAKVVRSAMGASFRLPLVPVTMDELGEFLLARGIPLWAADAGGDELEAQAAPARLALAVGNEGAGLSAALLDLAERRVAVPISTEVESLNVAVATGILLYLLRM